MEKPLVTSKEKYIWSKVTKYNYIIWPLVFEVRMKSGWPKYVIGEKMSLTSKT